MLSGHSLSGHSRSDRTRRFAERPWRRKEYELLLNPMGGLNNSGWRAAWRKAGIPIVSDIRRGVHNLRHSFGRRLRGAGVALETRKVLLGLASGDITTHYSAAELRELLKAAEKIVDRKVAQGPTLTLVSRKKSAVGKVSENKTGLVAVNL